MAKRKILLFFVCFAVSSLIAAPARADLFEFSYSRLETTWTQGTGIFEASISSETIGSVTDSVPPTTTAAFLWGIGMGTLGGFDLSMTIDNIAGTGTWLDPYSADGSGSFTITDIDGDTITGNLAGTWEHTGSSNNFTGTLSGITFNNESGDWTFEGHLGSFADMSFLTIPPYHGTLIQLTAAGLPWFGLDSWENQIGGSVDASVLPVPTAVVLGMLGLSAAGLKLRKFA